MRIVLGSDHGGYKYKKELIKYLNELGHETIDVCTYDKDVPASWSVHALKAALKIKNNEADAGVVLCRSGIGVSIAANKVNGIYCGLAYTDRMAQLCKAHDGCNMIAIPADYCSLEDAKKRVKIFLTTEFEGGRHLERLNQLKDYEKYSKID